MQCRYVSLLPMPASFVTTVTLPTPAKIFRNGGSWSNMVAHTAWMVPSKSDGWMMYPAGSEMVVHMVSPTKCGPRSSQSKTKSHATCGHCPLHSNNTGWICWDKWCHTQNYRGNSGTKWGFLQMFSPMKCNDRGYPAPMDTHLPWSTPGLDLGHRSSISFYRRSHQDCVACHGIPVRARTSPTICWQMRTVRVNVFNASKLWRQQNLPCCILVASWKLGRRFGQRNSSYAHIRWCKYEHMDIDTVSRMYMHMDSTCIYSIEYTCYA